MGDMKFRLMKEILCTFTIAHGRIDPDIVPYSVLFGL